MNTNNLLEEKYLRANIEREKHIEAILKSQSKKKIVVAGAGTGKTFLFKQVLQGKTNTLTLTFINNLVEDLALELCGISDVKTLHGFARSIVATQLKREVEIFSKLPTVVKEDALILLGEDIDFDRLFHNRDDTNKLIQFYLSRRNYYGDYFGFLDVIFTVVRMFEKESDAIPIYNQIVVDEFQDFNLLEVSLIELLAQKSPILLAGDDDQALYWFKSASTKHIRLKYSETDNEYESFSLPYCSRCTEVIVGAVNDTLTQAEKSGCLQNRISKKYIYFPDKEKDEVCLRYPKIVYAQLYSAQIPWLIESELSKIAEKEKQLFSVLVISPIRTQSRTIVKSLKSRGLNITEVGTKAEEEPNIVDGLKILLTDKKSNLGWRIIAKHLLNPITFKPLLSQTQGDGSKLICDIVPKDFRNGVNKLLKIFRSIKNNNKVDKSSLNEVLDRIGIDADSIAVDTLRQEINSTLQRIGNPALRKIPIKATTIQGSKGLSADYVFITHFDDQYFIKDKNKSNISDQDIYNFLVSLTRAKKRVVLISSSKDKIPAFISWINRNRIETIS